MELVENVEGSSNPLGWTITPILLFYFFLKLQKSP